MLKRNTFMIILALFVVVPIFTVAVSAQINPPSGVNAPSSQKYTLQQICDRLENGANPERMTSFTGPESGPVSATMCSTNDIMGFAPSIDNSNGANIGDVLIGRTFWGLRSDGWGPLKGGGCPTTMSCVARTGQTASYLTGDDGDTQRGADTTPRLTDNGDGTVTDNLTGLVWLQDADCYSSQNWASALSDVNNLANGSCGLSDGSTAGNWRVPNVVELESLQITELSDLLPDGHPFIGNIVSRLFWTSTTCANDDSTAWQMSFKNNQTFPVLDCDNKTAGTFGRRAWPVRDSF